MATEYKGFNIPEKALIVRKEITTWEDGEYKGTGNYQGYFVPYGNTKMLETALHWAGCKSEWSKEESKCVYPNRENYIMEYTNGTFELSLSYSAANSSQSGKLSFWDCTITAEDGNSYLIGINADLLCALLKNNTFIDGKCQNKVYLGRQGSNRTGAFTTNMEEYQQAKQDAILRSRAMTTDYLPGQRVFSKKDSTVYLGTMYHRFFIDTIYERRTYNMHKVIVVYKKPVKVHVYGQYHYERFWEGNNYMRRTFLDKLGSCCIGTTKSKQYFNEGDMFEFSGDAYTEYAKLKTDQANYWINIDMKEPQTETRDRDIKSHEVILAEELAEYSSSSEPIVDIESLKEIVNNYCKYHSAYGTVPVNPIADYKVIDEDEYERLTK